MSFSHIFSPDEDDDCCHSQKEAAALAEVIPRCCINRFTLRTTEFYTTKETDFLDPYVMAERSL